MKTVVVTGTSGFIGSHLSYTLLKNGYKVIGVDNFSTGYRQNIKNLQTEQNFLFIEADVSKTDWLIKITDSIEYIFHFASPASPPLYQKLSLETIRVNTVGLENCLNLASLFKSRVIFASTSEIYGDPLIHPQPENYFGNVNSYGERSCYDEAKRLGESIIFSWNKKYKTTHGLVRIFNTYGPGMNPYDGRVIVNFLHQALSNKKLTIYGSGEQTRSFCYISDLIDGILKYTYSSITEPINLGNPNEFSINELAKTVNDLFFPKEIFFEYLSLPSDDPKQRQPDCSKASSLLNWSAKISLKQGLKIYLNDLILNKGFYE